MSTNKPHIKEHNKEINQTSFLCEMIEKLDIDRHKVPHHKIDTKTEREREREGAAKQKQASPVTTRGSM